jgi:NAD(P)-dependent dehydrogenase (short-subunit alcohol dehydrogenase family)
MSYWRDKVAVVTGGSAGFGRILALELAQAGAHVVVAARDTRRLDSVLAELEQAAAPAIAAPAGARRRHLAISADVTVEQDVGRLVQAASAEWGRIDLFVSNAGRSTRGLVLETTCEQFQEYLECNFLSVVRCARHAAPHLLESKGHLVNVGSLAAKTVSRFLGAYPASKFPVAAYSQQLRYELGPRGVHVLLLCPGPLAREDAGRRYDNEAAGLPETARRPGGGVRLRGLPMPDVARRTLRACERRDPELILPGKVRWLLALAQIAPRWSDWIVEKMTGGRQ